MASSLRLEPPTRWPTHIGCESLYGHTATTWEASRQHSRAAALRGGERGTGQSSSISSFWALANREHRRGSRHGNARSSARESALCANISPANADIISYEVTVVSTKSVICMFYVVVQLQVIDVDKKMFSVWHGAAWTPFCAPLLLPESNIQRRYSEMEEVLVQHQSLGRYILRLKGAIHDSKIPSSPLPLASASASWHCPRLGSASGSRLGVIRVDSLEAATCERHSTLWPPVQAVKIPSRPLAQGLCSSRMMFFHTNSFQWVIFTSSLVHSFPTQMMAKRLYLMFTSANSLVNILNNAERVLSHLCVYLHGLATSMRMISDLSKRLTKAYSQQKVAYVVQVGRR
ncbi:hypothetical protein B0H12DRAFT_1069921 [Mycena haematopus]|nr:hypothetical protein B0H12DRAFT_1069921 [Mycena haematopus]